MKKSFLAVALLTAAHALSGAPPTGGDDVRIVARLYRDFAWEAVVTAPEAEGAELLDQPREILERYFDADLATLILAERRCAKTTGEICSLDFMPIWDSQDPAATDLQIVASGVPGTVTVSYRYPCHERAIKLVYRLKETSEGWRISDIRYSSGYTLAGILRAAPQ